jgi:hypothetical protein
MEMVRSWLLPIEQPNLLSTFSAEFQFKERPEIYLVSEVSFSLANLSQVHLLLQSRLFLEKEILIGVCSSYYGNKILEMKGLSLDEKTGLIQERVTSLVRRFPHKFDHDLLGEMQHFLIRLKEPFKRCRDYEQMSRIIWILYYFSKRLEKAIEQIPGRRHLCLKIKRAKLETPFGLKEVLSIFVGLNFLKEHERFGERHVLSAIQSFFKEVKGVAGSYFEREPSKLPIHGCYIEIEKKNGQRFSSIECAYLKTLLSQEIQRRIEQLVPPIFMPRNEEEVMRNILTLSHQLKYTSDLPQVILSFEEQTDAEIAFTVVLVRLIKRRSFWFKRVLAAELFSWARSL